MPTVTLKYAGLSHTLSV